MRHYADVPSHAPRSPGDESGFHRPLAMLPTLSQCAANTLSTNCRVDSRRLKVSARARASSLGIERAARAARPRFASSMPAPLSPIPSSGPATGLAATGRPEASASSSTRPKVSVKLGNTEHVGARVGGGKPLVAHFADEMGSRKAPLKLLPDRTISNDSAIRSSSASKARRTGWSRTIFCDPSREAPRPSPSSARLYAAPRIRGSTGSPRRSERPRIRASRRLPPVDAPNCALRGSSPPAAPGSRPSRSAPRRRRPERAEWSRSSPRA